MPSFLLLLVFLVGFSASAQTTLTDPIPLAQDVKVGQLPNGLTYYIKKNNRPEKKVELRLVINAGSILEDDDQQGLAHFMEHMVFNGTKNFPKNELVSFLQSIGVEFGADLNAETGFDETIYILPIPVDKPENLSRGFQVLEDWASAATLDAGDIDKERGVVLEELRVGKGANDRMNKVIYPKLFEGSAYAERLPIGKEDILKKFKPEVLKRFYYDWYRPNLMAVIAVGDLDPTQVEKLIVQNFSKLKSRPGERPRTVVTIPARQKSEALIVTDPEAQNHVLQVYHAYTLDKIEKTIGDYRESIVRNLFSMMLSTRMQELTQSANPPFVFGGSSLGGFVRGYEVFSSYAVIGKAGVEAALTALVQENERARQFGFTAAELERSKKSVLRAMERAYNERNKTDSEVYAEELIRNFLEHEPIPGIALEYQYYQQFIPTISLEEVNAYAAAVIPGAGNELIILNGPEKSDITLPDKGELMKMYERATTATVNAYEEKQLALSLMESLPKGGKIVSEKHNAAVGITELVLSNGIKVIYKPTEFKNDQVLMSATRWGGQSLASLEDQYNAAYATTLVAQMGVANFSPMDLRKVLAGKSVSVLPRMSMLSEGFSGQCGSSDLESLLQLTYLYATQPRTDADLFKSFTDKQQPLYQNLMSNPQAVFQDSVQAILYSRHPRAPRVPKSDDLNQVSINKVMDIYKSRLGNADGMTFIFVGSFNVDELRKGVAQYLAALPTRKDSHQFKDLGIRPVKGVVQREVKRGSEEKSYVSLIFTGEAPFSEADQLRLLIATEIFNIKLIETLREDLGGIYGGGMSGTLNKYPYPHYSVSISFPCGPENVDRLIAATWDEIRKMKKDGPSAADLQKVKETLTKQYLESVKDNGYWLAKLQQVVELGSDPLNILTGEQRIASVTAQQVKDVVVKLFDDKNYVQVVLYPEKK